MSEIIELSIAGTSRALVIRALTAYRRHAEQRYDPSFVPKPGKVDRNVEIMRIGAMLLDRIGVPETGAVVLQTTDAERRILRQALLTYGTRPNDEIPATDMHDASKLAESIPDAGTPSANRPEPQARVERVADYHVR